jgi:hypothetical protein
VNQLNLCVDILERVEVTPGWTEAQAVWWLIHLLGDIHQPLHVTTGYYKIASAKLAKPKLIVDPLQTDKPGILGD